MADAPKVLAALDRIEGYRAAEPERSLYKRVRVPATLDDGRTEDVWVYFYNAPLGRAPRIRQATMWSILKAKIEPATPITTARRARLYRFDEVLNDLRIALGWLDELDARSIGDDFLIHVADAAVGDAAFQDDRLVPQRQPDVVQRIEMQRKRRFDQAAAVADFLDGERLEDHHLAMQLAEDLDPLAIRFSSGVPSGGKCNASQREG